MLALALSLGLRAAAAGEPSSEPAGLELRWDAPPQCPDRAQLLAAIDATLGEVAEGERRSLRARGRVRADPQAGFVVRLELDDGHASTRELRGTSCEELTDAAALVIAMTIDPRLLDTLQGPPEVAEPEVPEAEPGVPEAEPGVTEGPSRPAPSEPEPIASGGSAERAPRDPEAPSARSTRRRSPASLHFLGRAQAGLGGGPLPDRKSVV